MTGPRYAFGDSELARRRMDVVADVFAGPSTEFVRQQVTFRPQLALDLGCGPGNTTRMLADVTRAALVVGLDTSEAFLRDAVRETRSSPVAYACHDARTPFPTQSPDLVYARLILAHLADPPAVATSWARQLRAGGLLLLDEVEWIGTDHPVLALYEEVVVGLVGARGAPMYAGPLISGLSGQDWRPISDRIVPVDVVTADAARMYSMNLAVWRDDPYVVNNYDTSQIDDLAAGLDELTRSSAAGEITWGLRQVAYERV